MFDPKEVIIAVLPPYLFLVIGAVLRIAGVLKRDHDEGTMRIAFHVLYPCLVLDKILGSAALNSVSAVAWPIALGFGLIVAGIGIGWLVGRVIGLEKGTGMRTFALSSGLQNFGYTAIPIVERLWPVGAMSILFVHNLGVELAVWSVGVMLLSGSNRVEWRKLVNGPVFAVITGLILVALGADNWFTPGEGTGSVAQQFVAFPIRKCLSLLGSGAFPVALLITGALILDMGRSERPSLRIMIAGCVVRLVLSPLVILAAAKYLPVAVEMKQVLVVQAAMPAALGPIMIARLYGGRSGIAVQVVIATTLVSLLTLPLIITWGSAWLGLKAGLP